MALTLNTATHMTTIEQVQHLKISNFDYPLPDERIAKHPLKEREQCKLLTFSPSKGIGEGHFYDVPALLPQGCMLVYNNTRVINARMRFRKETGSMIEIFCLEPARPCDYEQIFQTTDTCTWLCLVGNSKRWRQGALKGQVNIDGEVVNVTATRGEHHGNSFEITFSWDKGDVTFATLLDAIGEIPIPPYLNRDTEESDRTDYQTVYSHIDGSVAAPTAGLHFTNELLAECDRRGITRRELTLHVGAGTFQPVKSEHIGEHEMHYEFIAVKRSLLNDMLNATRPIVAVGTTSVRTLESLYYIGQVLETCPDADAEQLTVRQWMPYSTPCNISTRKALQNIIGYLDRHHTDTYIGSTQLMIAPGFQYRVVEGMITNFHQPQSTLLLLVSAFVGDDNWRPIYNYALEHGFRFLSYGDACLFLK